MAPLPGLNKGVFQDPAPPAVDFVLAPITIPNGTTLVTTKTTNETIVNVDELIDYVSGDNGPNFIPQLAIDSLVSDLAARELTANKGAVNGYAGLDASQELLLANFPTGTALQVLRRNAANTALEFADVDSGGQVDSVVGTTNRISVDSADPVNPIVDIDAAYVGQTSITTLGTITTGVWNGTAITGAFINAASTDLTDTADIAYLNTPNTYIAGNKQSFVADAATAAINLNAQLPSALVTGDIYRTAEMFHFIGTSLTDYILVSNGQPTTYTAGAKQNFLGLLGGTAGINVGGIAGNPTTQVDGDIWLNTSTNQLFGRISGANVDLGDAGITSLNGDTAAVQTLTGGDGIDITDATPDHSFAVDATVARDTDNLGFFASTTSVQLLGVISDETGTGLLVFNDTPTLLTPIIASFTNAVHNHQDAAGGGTLLSTSALSDTTDIAYLNTANVFITGNKQSVRHDATNAGLRVMPNTGNPSDQTVGDVWVNDTTNKMFVRINTVDVLLSTNIITINFVIDGGGSVITTGIKGQLVVDFDCTVIEWAIIGLPAGAIVVDVSKSTFAGFPTTVSIAGSELPTIIATNDTGEDRAITWTNIITGDILEFEVDSVATIQRCTVALKCLRT